MSESEANRGSNSAILMSVGKPVGKNEPSNEPSKMEIFIDSNSQKITFY
jgi:hypothetical protein